LRQAWAIARRETGAFFHSAMAPVVVGGFLVLVGLFFTLFAFGYAEMCLTALKSGKIDTPLNMAEGVFQPVIADMAIFLLFLLPAVTMRLFAEEYRSGRYDLVMSYPVADHVWVTGKFLSLLAVAALLIAAGGLYILVASVLSHPEPGPLLAAALGLGLLAAAIGAWGVFFSTLFQYQVVSYFLAFACVLLLYTIDGLAPHLSGVLARMATEFSWRVHFVRFSWGVVDSRDICFFLAWIWLGLSSAAASLAGRRLALGRRPLRWLPTCVLGILLLVVYLIAARYPVTSDWTRDKRYSLAPQTVQVLASLPQDVWLYAFYQRLDPQRQAVEVMLRACRDRSPRVHYEMIDPERELSLVEKYELNASRSVVVEVGQKHTVLLEPDEGRLINAVYRLATGTRPVVYQLLGHGEHRLDSDDRGGYAAYATVLAENGYELRPLLLADNPVVPADADICVIAAPKLDYADAELAALQDFIRRGGAVLALFDPGTPGSLAAWAADYNIRLGDDFIVSASGRRRQYGVDARVVVVFDSYGEHELTRGMPGVATLFPFAQSLQPIHAGMVGVDGEWILRSDLQSWAEKDAMTIASGRPEYDEGVDRPGPVVFGVALELNRREYFELSRHSTGPRREEAAPSDDPVLGAYESLQNRPAGGPAASIFSQQETSRIVIIGDSDFAANANLNLYGNRDLLLNILAWLARERVLIELRPRESIGEPLILSVAQKDIIGWGSILGWPLLVTVATILLVVRHRRRSSG
jgi:ABC-type transport system involved in multi-copper enzyme maturation permease subunit